MIITLIVYQWKQNVDMMKEEIWIECDCGYEGFADMVKYEGMKYKHPTCPDCGEVISEIIELPKDEWIDKINR